MISRHLLAFCVAAAALPGIAVAAEDRSVNVPSEEAAQSIPELARQEGIQIVVPVDQLLGIKTPAINGTMSVNQAVGDILAGTGLKMARNDGKTVMLERVSTAADVMQAPAGEAAGTATSGPQQVTTVTVTGSRVISDIQASPTPVTIVSTEQLQETTPTDLPDGLNKLPVFGGSIVPRTGGNGGAATGINVLDLRNFGDQRTLVLLDGHRAPPSNSDGSVDVDTLPQMLVSRVDVVTGGASAVYGSDAVTGVVNFVLDKHFNGLKFDVNGGISTYGDGASFKGAAAFGTDLFGGRGHFEASLRHYQEDAIPLFARPYGPEVITQTGSGTAAKPFTSTINSRRADSTFGGLVSACAAPCPALGMQFVDNGVLGPFVPGQTTNTTNVNSGGDGAYSKFGTAQVGVRQNEAFSRFSYDVDDNTVFYVQGIAAETFSNGWWFPTKETVGAASPSAVTQASTFYTTNPYLPVTVQAALNPTGVANKTFSLGEYFVGPSPTDLPGTRTVNRNLSFTTGLDGTVFSKFSWDLYYTHGENRQALDNLNNTNYQNQFAAADSVLNSAGQAVCYASTQAATAAEYANCVPTNPFGPTALTQGAYNYITATTYYHQTNVLDDVGGNFSGAVFDDWAGPINAALSFEYRANDYTVDSNASPTAKVNCTGLRICSSSLALWAQNVDASAHATNNVWEVAGEVDAPLLKDVPLAQNVSLDLAGRYTDYSTSGAVQTWKAGLNWQVNDSVRLRATNSIDIRAPTLNDLFSPPQSSVTGFNDLLTSVNSTVFTSTQGNPNLVPEVARTYTAGVVLTPDFIPGLTTSFDYYVITLKNAITSLSATSTSIEVLCNASGGTSPYCQLFQRPHPYTDTSSDNYPTEIFSSSVNAALNQIQGWDYETDYSWQMSDLVADWGGSWTTRLLANYQPVNESIAFTGATLTQAAAPKTHVTGFLRYTLDDWAIGLEDRWLGGFSKITQAGLVFTQPHVHSVNYLDLDLERNFQIDNGKFTTYFTVQNLANAQSDIYPTSSSIGLNYPIPSGQDVMGRYFTIGLRANL